MFIYISKPVQRIRIKTIVTKSNFDESELIGNDLQYNISNIRTRKKYFRLKLVKFIDNDLLSLDKLQNYGINGNIQGKETLKKETTSYILANEDDDTHIDYILLEKLNDELEKNILTSKYNSKKREERLAKANRKPEEVKVVSRGFKRNADVVVAVLERANGFCEECGSEAPFKRKKDNSPYLEVHHIIQLANGGDDTVENTIAVCPNCHRRLHFG